MQNGIICKKMMVDMVFSSLSLFYKKYHKKRLTTADFGKSEIRKPCTAVLRRTFDIHSIFFYFWKNYWKKRLATPHFQKFSSINIGRMHPARNFHVSENFIFSLEISAKSPIFGRVFRGRRSFAEDLSTSDTEVSYVYTSVFLGNACRRPKSAVCLYSWWDDFGVRAIGQK